MQKFTKRLLNKQAVQASSISFRQFSQNGDDLDAKINSFNLKDFDVQKLAINYSIIHKQESYSINQNKWGSDIAIENERFPNVLDLGFSSDLEVIRNANLDEYRGARSIFLESENRNIHPSEYNEVLLRKYADQIQRNFPGAKTRISSILNLRQPIKISEEDQKALSQQIQESMDELQGKGKDQAAQVSEIPNEEKLQMKTRKIIEESQTAEDEIIEQMKIDNKSFEEQQDIQKQLLVEQDGGSGSDYESGISDVEDLIPHKEGQYGQHSDRKDRIFKHLKIIDKSVRIPNLHEDDKEKLTLFIDPDEVLLHTFICDENLGYIANPAAKDPEHEVFFQEINQPALVYMRDHYQKFLDFLKDNEDYIEPIIYTSGLKFYNDKIMEILDPDREIFKTRLYQNACYVFEIKEEEILYMMKDISRFQNRDIRRMLLIDSKPVNFIMTPENVIPAIEYTAEFDTKEKIGAVDTNLLEIMDDIESIKEFEDIRPALAAKYQVRSVLRNSKLI